MGLVDRLLAGDLAALARLATHIENDTGVGREALDMLYSRTGQAHVVGVTGAPGSGKSTLINTVIKNVRASGRRIGVVAVDPTSPLTRGATLGDRIRMLDSWSDDGVFIRSMASRGRRGGLAPATAGIVHLLDVAGFELVIVETVGIGQEEIDIASHAHTVALVQVPGLGDSVQTIKAGVLEVADIYIVNKSDRPGANDVARELRALVGPLGQRESDAWLPPIVKTDSVAAEGIDNVVLAIDAHRDYLRKGTNWNDRVRAMAAAEVHARLWQLLRERFEQGVSAAEPADNVIDDVARRIITPSAAVDRLLADLMAKDLIQ